MDSKWITISCDGVEIGDWGAEPAESVLARFAEFVSERTGVDDVELKGSHTRVEGCDFDETYVDVVLWNEFCASQG